MLRVDLKIVYVVLDAVRTNKTMLHSHPTGICSNILHIQCKIAWSEAVGTNRGDRFVFRRDRVADPGINIYSSKNGIKWKRERCITVLSACCNCLNRIPLELPCNNSARYSVSDAHQLSHHLFHH